MICAWPSAYSTSVQKKRHKTDTYPISWFQIWAINQIILLWRSGFYSRTPLVSIGMTHFATKFGFHLEPYRNIICTTYLLPHHLGVEPSTHSHTDICGWSAAKTEITCDNTQTCGDDLNHKLDTLHDIYICFKLTTWYTLNGFKQMIVLWLDWAQSPLVNQMPIPKCHYQRWPQVLLRKLLFGVLAWRQIQYHYCHITYGLISAFFLNISTTYKILVACMTTP